MSHVLMQIIYTHAGINRDESCINVDYIKKAWHPLPPLSIDSMHMYIQKVYTLLQLTQEVYWLQMSRGELDAGLPCHVLQAMRPVNKFSSCPHIFDNPHISYMLTSLLCRAGMRRLCVHTDLLSITSIALDIPNGCTFMVCSPFTSLPSSLLHSRFKKERGYGSYTFIVSPSVHEGATTHYVWESCS